MDTLKLIAIVGMPGAGKSVAADFFQSKGIPILRFGDQTDIGLKEFGLEKNEKNERWVREKLREELGMAAMAIKIEPRIIEAAKTHAMVVLDGLYSWEEYIVLKKKFPMLQLLCIYASPKVRRERLQHRAVRPLTEEESASRDIAELENFNKGGPIAVADYLIINQSDESHFQKELEQYFTTL
ncbi:MAG: AAA family ATPase [Candidatus Gottesmanbacteria bacterium]